MYESHFGFSTHPFLLTPDPAFLYSSRQHAMAETILEYGLESRASFCLLTGDIGSGKTLLVSRLLRKLGKDVVVGLISHTHSRFCSIYGWAASALRLQPRDDSDVAVHEALIEAFEREYTKGRRTLLIVDEAQNLSVELLEELRLLSNVNSEKDLLLQIMLVGQPELRKQLSRPELEQFAQRVSVHCHLTALESRETHAYVQHRLEVVGGNPALFLPDAIDLVHAHTRGVPRLINQLCDFALTHAYAEGRTAIDAALIRKTLQDPRGGFALPPPATIAAPTALAPVPVAAALSPPPAAAPLPIPVSQQPAVAEPAPERTAAVLMPGPAQSSVPFELAKTPAYEFGARRRHGLVVALALVLALVITGVVWWRTQASPRTAKAAAVTKPVMAAPATAAAPAKREGVHPSDDNPAAARLPRPASVSRTVTAAKEIGPSIDIANAQAQLRSQVEHVAKQTAADLPTAAVAAPPSPEPATATATVMPTGATAAAIEERRYFAPHALSSLDVHYPTDVADDVEGHVTLEFSIRADGRASDVAVIDTQPKGVFDRAAIEAIQHGRFDASVQTAHPDERARLKLTFKLR